MCLFKFSNALGQKWSSRTGILSLLGRTKYLESTNVSLSSYISKFTSVSTVLYSYQPSPAADVSPERSSTMCKESSVLQVCQNRSWQTKRTPLLVSAHSSHHNPCWLHCYCPRSEEWCRDCRQSIGSWQKRKCWSHLPTYQSKGEMVYLCMQSLPGKYQPKPFSHKVYIV